MKSLQKLVIALLFLQSYFHLSACADWNAFFNPNKTMIEFDTTEEIHLILTNTTDETIDNNYVLKTQNEKVAVVDNPGQIEFSKVVGESGSWEAHFRVRGVFLGETFFKQVF